jgi:26S proteasome subunit RPN6 C-terminal helix domain
MEGSCRGGVLCGEHAGRIAFAERCCVSCVGSLQMILDKKFAGTLDQGAGCLEVFDEVPPDMIYPAALETFDNMGRVIDTLFTRSQKIVA